MNADTLPQTVARLFAILDERQFEYLLVGDVVLRRYIESRNTDCLELILSRPSLKKLPEIQIASEDADFARGKFAELQIDILLTRNRLFEKVQRKYATTQPFAERDIPCATVEGLLLLKLYALPSLYHQADFAQVGLYENDIATLIHDYRPELEALFAELGRHLSETDLAAVREVVAEIQQRIARFGKGIDKGE